MRKYGRALLELEQEVFPRWEMQLDLDDGVAVAKQEIALVAVAEQELELGRWERSLGAFVFCNDWGSCEEGIGCN
jgi:hypothetical protein